MDKQLFGWLMMSVGLAVGVLLGLLASPVPQQGPDTPSQVVRDSWEGVRSSAEKPQRFDLEEELAWDRPEPELDESVARQDAACAIQILEMQGLEVTLATVWVLGDWSDMAYGGHCAHLEALLDG